MKFRFIQIIGMLGTWVAFLATFMSVMIRRELGAYNQFIIVLLLFSAGGFTGLIMSSAGMDHAIHDPYYIVAHFHYVLSIGALFGIFSSFLLV